MESWTTRRLRMLALALWLGACVFAAPAGAVTPALDTFGPLGDSHTVFPQVEHWSYSAVTAADVGDVNGDGRDDTALAIDTNGIWVNFTPSVFPSDVSAGQPGWNGFFIKAGSEGALAGVGDVNGDGLGDIAFGTPWDAWVVFGRTDGKTVDLGNDPSAGFHITNIGMSGNIGFGNLGSGMAWENSVITGVGDQNGDGHPDLALRDRNSVKVIYTPANPAGATVDASALGTGGFTLNCPGNNPTGPHVGDLGDINGDGRDDLAVVWEDPGTHTVYAAGAVSPSAGGVVDLGTVADSHTGFKFVMPNRVLENGIVVGDQSGDGRKDIGIVAFPADPMGDRDLTIAYAPDLGVTRDVAQPAASEGEAFHVYDGNVIDVGDQDGDGRDDIGVSSSVWLSSTRTLSNAASVGLNAWASGDMTLGGIGGILVGALGDLNGDGRRELVAALANPYQTESPYAATWHLNVFLSAPPPVAQTVSDPVQVPGGVDISGTFTTDPGEALRTLAAQPSVQITDPAAPAPVPVTTTGDVVNANAATTSASVHVDGAETGLVAGRTYNYRMLLGNSRGMVGASDWRSFTYTGSPPPAGAPPGAKAPGAPAAPTPPAMTHPASITLRRGTRRADRLRGTIGIDYLYGLGGNDVLRGLAGRDRLYGGSGRDLIYARDGEVDLVDCGPGRDRAIVDRRDRVRHCERVSRS